MHGPFWQISCMQHTCACMQWNACSMHADACKLTGFLTGFIYAHVACNKMHAKTCVQKHGKTCMHTKVHVIASMPEITPLDRFHTDACKHK